MGRRSISFLVSGASVCAVIALPSLASAQDVTTPATVPTTTTTEATTPATGTTGLAGATAPKPKQDGRSPAHMSVVVHGIHKDRKVRIGKPVRAFDFHSKDLIAPGSYKVIAEHERTANQRRVVARSKKFGVDYPDLDPGNRSSVVRTFNQLLNRRGYFSSHGKKYNVRTQWAVMAFRKVNGMARNYNATPQIFRKLAANKGKFHLAYPGGGKHVEVDISKQVMALANHGKAQHVFAVSTGAPATPTVRGHYHFYRKDPGYNSEGMYYSVYFIRGYATHGYNPVPPYNASHGCVRNPIPDSIFIYNWISLGDSIWVYQ
jgi:hypothetical protein